MSDEMWDVPMMKHNGQGEGHVLWSSTSLIKSTLDAAIGLWSSASRRNELDAHTEFAFWTSESAKHVYCILLFGLLIRQPILFYGVLFILFRKIAEVCASWTGYYAQDRQARIALGSLRAFLRLLVNESEKAVSGDFSRQVVAAYMIYNCTAPGESYFGYLVRYKMSMINRQVIEELKDWRERKLGYEKSARNVFA